MFDRLTLLAAAVVLGCGVSASAQADTVSFTLSDPAQSVATTGGVLKFDATIAAPLTNSGLEYLNGDFSNISPALPGFDDTTFFSDFPLFLAPGDSFSGLFFTLQVPAGAAGTTYLGSIGLLGGATGDTYDVIGSQNFSVAVTSAVVAAVPEAASWAVMMTGLGMVGGTLRRRRAARVRVRFA